MFDFSIEKIVSLLTVTGILIKVGCIVFRFCKKQYETVSTAHKQLNLIFKELTPNGGGSMKDKINHMSKEITTNTTMTEQIYYRQRWMLDHRTESIFEADKSGQIHWVNKPYCILTGRDSTDLLGHNWKNTVHEDDRERVVANWDACVKDERQFEDEYRMITPNGEVINVICSASRVGNGYIGNIRISI